MNRVRLARDAFKNMMRAAERDPLWAFLALIAMPFRIWKRLLGFMLILFIVTFVIGMGGGHFLHQTGFSRGSPVYIIPGFLTLLALAVITFRFITTPLILHFGNSDDDTHVPIVKKLETVGMNVCSNRRGDRACPDGNALPIAPK